MADFTIKKGDRLPVIQATLKDSSGTAVDLTGATVRFHMARPDKTVVVDAAAVVLSPATDGRVEYQWGASDTGAPGDYLAEWEVTFQSGREQTFPNDGYLTVRIVEALA